RQAKVLSKSGTFHIPGGSHARLRTTSIDMRKLVYLLMVTAWQPFSTRGEAVSGSCPKKIPMRQDPSHPASAISTELCPGLPTAEFSIPQIPAGNAISGL